MKTNYQPTQLHPDGQNHTVLLPETIAKQVTDLDEYIKSKHEELKGDTGVSVVSAKLIEVNNNG